MMVYVIFILYLSQSVIMNMNRTEGKIKELLTAFRTKQCGRKG